MGAGDGGSTTAGGRRRGRRRWAVLAALATSLALMLSGCTLWVGKQVQVQVGTSGLYAYIGSYASSQIQDVYTSICRRDANCTSTIMTRVNLGVPDWVRNAWNEAWWHWYSQGEAMAQLNQIAFNRYVSGGQLNTCLVLVKTTLPFPTPGGVINYRWQTRAVGHDACIHGFFFDIPRAKGRDSAPQNTVLRLKGPKSRADQQSLFCAPLEGTPSGTDPAASLARRLVSADLASDRGRAGTSIVPTVVNSAPPGVAGPAKRLIAAIELGRAKRGVAALKTANARDAIGDVDAWAQAHC